MKWLILASLVCNQIVYDQIYLELSHQAMKTEDYQTRANSIELLRKLCNGQLSSWEKGMQK